MNSPSFLTSADKQKFEAIINELHAKIAEVVARLEKLEGKPQSNVNDSVGTKQS
jgi:hypothetical protein